MEYVKVIFPTNRFVYIDSEKSGTTNDVLRVEAGTHLFTLGNVANYKPTSRKVVVTDTTLLEPLELVFTRTSQD